MWIDENSVRIMQFIGNDVIDTFSDRVILRNRNIAPRDLSGDRVDKEILIINGIMTLAGKGVGSAQTQIIKQAIVAAALGRLQSPTPLTSKEVNGLKAKVRVKMGELVDVHNKNTGH